jgi:hypothetical protein
VIIFISVSAFVCSLIPAGASMPVVLERLFVSFFSIEDEDMRLFPYLECFTSLLPLCALQVKDAVQPLLQRCLRLLDKTLKTSDEVCCLLVYVDFWWASSLTHFSAG